MTLLIIEDSKLIAERQCFALAGIPDLTRMLMFGTPPYFRPYCEQDGADIFFDKANEFATLTGTVGQMAEAAA